MTAHPQGWQVGMKVYAVAGRSISGKWYTVTKVGRRWITVDEYPNDWRFDGKTGEVDDSWPFTCSGCVYKNEAEHQTHLSTVADQNAKYAAWISLRKAIYDRYQRPPHLTLADIQAMQAKIEGVAE